MQDELLMGFLEEATSAYEEGMLPSSPAVEYLEGRGIVESARLIARLGCVTNDNVQPGHEPFVGHLSIPYITPSGVVALKFRRLDGGQPKYTAPLGQRVRMYNVMALQERGDTIVICEGELDAIVLGMADVKAVAVAGVTQWKPHFPRMLRGFSNVIVVADNDKKDDGSNPGQDLAHRIVESIPRARNVLLPDGMDVNEYYLAAGPEALRTRLGIHV